MYLNPPSSYSNEVAPNLFLLQLTGFNQYEIGPFLTASQALNGILTDVGTVRKGFGNEPLEDITMESVKVEEFKESLCKDCGWVNLVLL